MKGLLIKDLMAAWKSVISCTLIMVITIAITKVLAMDNFDSSVIFFIIVFCGSIISYMIISDDDKSGFLKYMKILPVRRKLVVMEKFIMALVIMGIFSTIGLIGMYVNDSFSTENLWKIIYVTLPIGIVICAVILSLVIIFGTEKALLIIVISFPILVIGIGGILGIIDLNYYLNDMVYIYRHAILVVSIVVYVISFLITSNIYDLLSNTCVINRKANVKK